MRREGEIELAEQLAHTLRALVVTTAQASAAEGRRSFETLAADLEAEAAVNLKRVVRPSRPDWGAEPSLSRMTAFLETKTVWHPVGV